MYIGAAVSNSPPPPPSSACCCTPPHPLPPSLSADANSTPPSPPLPASPLPPPGHLHVMVPPCRPTRFSCSHPWLQPVLQLLLGPASWLRPGDSGQQAAAAVQWGQCSCSSLAVCPPPHVHQAVCPPHVHQGYSAGQQCLPSSASYVPSTTPGTPLTTPHRPSPPSTSNSPSTPQPQYRSSASLAASSADLQPRAHGSCSRGSSRGLASQWGAHSMPTPPPPRWSLLRPTPPPLPSHHAHHTHRTSSSYHTQRDLSSYGGVLGGCVSYSPLDAASASENFNTMQVSPCMC